MKKILITGSESYIGTSLEKWLKQYPKEYQIDTIDVKNDEWRNKSFTAYDVIFHVAAIVHIKEKDHNKYFKVNRDLAYNIAKKAKQDKVKQFIFLSTMSVYGKETGFIDEHTKLNPKTPCAKSKLEAENLISDLDDNSFKAAILRPPIVYGKNCKGNYPRLVKLALSAPLFPDINNKRSMLYIDNLSKFIQLVIDEELSGIYFPQNKEYINTTELVQLIAKTHGKKLKATRGFNIFVRLGIKLSATFAKVFGSLTYDKRMPGGPEDMSYEACLFEDTIIRSESVDS